MMELDQDAMRRAVRERDRWADGVFFYAVLTTGVFCFPSCAARPALDDNLRYFSSREAALNAGYRACRRCRPDLAPRADRDRDMVVAACRRIDAGVFDLNAACSAEAIGKVRFAAVFRHVTGVSVAAYVSARRHRVAKAGLSAGAAVTETLYRAGFGSSGRFYEAADAMLGMTPSAWRAGGAGQAVNYTCTQSWLGRVLVAATGRGICAILIGGDDTQLLADLAGRLPRATLVPGGPAFRAYLDGVVSLLEVPAQGHNLPLDIAGTVFQRRVWQALCRIPPGSTTSYGKLAAELGLPNGARAVAGACAANPLAVAVPCHRVVGATGELTGYRWETERKQALLAREAKSTRDDGE